MVQGASNPPRQPHVFIKPESVPAKRPPKSMHPAQEPGKAMSLPKQEHPIATIASTGCCSRMDNRSIKQASAQPVAPKVRLTRPTSPNRLTNRGVNQPVVQQLIPARNNGGAANKAAR